MSQILNIARETCLMEFSQIKGVSEYERREVGVNLTAGIVNAVEIGQKILSVAPMDVLLEGYLKSKNKT